MNKRLVFGIALLLSVMVAVPLFAWHEKEHFAVTSLAGRVLPDPVGMPRWFVEGVADTSAHCSIDPDIFKDRKLPQLYHAEYPEHYFDGELLAGVELPPLRFDYYKLCYARGLDPRDVGTLPWAVTEWTQKLTIAFVEHRRWPDLESTKHKCLVYAGILAHYAADLQQPLHTTVHWDGRVVKIGDPSPRTGIHIKVDGLFRHLDIPGDQLIEGLSAQRFDDVWSAVNAELGRSHTLVDRVYELEADLPALDQPMTDDAVRDFAVERMRASIQFTASLYRTAWENSATLKPPFWLDREQLQSP